MSHHIYIFFALLPLGRYSRFALACSPARSRKLRHFCFAKLQKRAAEQRVTFSRFPSLEKRKASKSMQTRLPCKHLVNFKHRSFLTLPFPLGTCLQREASYNVDSLTHRSSSCLQLIKDQSEPGNSDIS